MNISENQSLKPYHTFGLEVKARKLGIFSNVEELVAGLNLGIQPTMILGGGSNLIFTTDYPGLVLVNRIKGKEIIKETEEDVLVAFGAGENWHECVLWALEQNFGGIENLSLIPGTMGAAPIQNIGAYGVELKETFYRLEALHLETQEIHTFSSEDCRFGYRDSVFKNKLKGNYCITRVWLKLSKRNHDINTSYGAIQSYLTEKGVINPSIRDVSDAVIAIRSSKLPDPAVLGNSGSFFKNPEIEQAQFDQLKQQYPNIVFYPLPGGKIKVPAGWLIDQAGWKGKRIGNTGCYEKQALVIVNHGGATGEEVWQHALRVKASVEGKFGIKLVPEVNVI